MSQQFFFFIDESGDPNFYARRKRPLWTEPNKKSINRISTVPILATCTWSAFMKLIQLIL